MTFINSSFRPLVFIDPYLGLFLSEKFVLPTIDLRSIGNTNYINDIYALFPHGFDSVFYQSNYTVFENYNNINNMFNNELLYTISPIHKFYNIKYEYVLHASRGIVEYVKYRYYQYIDAPDMVQFSFINYANIAVSDKTIYVGLHDYGEKLAALSLRSK